MPDPNDPKLPAPAEDVRAFSIWFSPIVRAETHPYYQGVFALTLRSKLSDGTVVSGPLATFADVDVALGAIRNALAHPTTGKLSARALSELALVRLTLVEGTPADWRACLMRAEPNRIAVDTVTMALTGWRVVPSEEHRFAAGTPMLPLLSAVDNA